MMYAQLVRRVQKILRRRSPYRYEDSAVLTAIEAIAVRMRAPHLQRRKIVVRAAERLMGAGR